MNTIFLSICLIGILFLNNSLQYESVKQMKIFENIKEMDSGTRSLEVAKRGFICIWKICSKPLSHSKKWKDNIRLSKINEIKSQIKVNYKTLFADIF